MKKSVLVLIGIMLFVLTTNIANAKATSNNSLSSAIRLYKARNYAQSYTAFSNIVKKDPSNAVAYYYLAMTAAQVGKKDEAIENYEKVLTLSSNDKLTRYAKKGKICLESPDRCSEPLEGDSDMDRFIRSKFGSGFSEEARSEYEKQKIENFMREMNRDNDISPRKFKEYRDFSSEVPTNDEIVTALRTLQRAGLGNFAGSGNNDYDMLNMFLGKSSTASLSPQVIQSLITNQMSF